MPTNANQTFLTHLAELRTRLLKSLIFFILAFGVCVYFARDIYFLLARPLKIVLPKGSHFIATHPFEGWITYLKTALFAALFLAMPFIFWQVWRFVAPGLYRTEKRYTLLFVFLTSLFFVGGAVFGYFYAFPFAFQYFTGLLEDTGIVFLPQMNTYLGFSFRLLIAFGLVFELPIFMVILSATGLVSIRKLIGFQKYMIVLAFTLSAILTPPDVITQLLMGLPIILLYQIGLLFAWLLRRREKKQTV